MQWQSNMATLPANFRGGLPTQLFNMPWLALLLGFVIGLPENLWHRYHAAERREAAIEKVLRPREAKLTWKAYASNLVECLPMMTSHILAIIIVYALGLPIYPAVFSVGIASWLKYPEIKANSEEAIRRLTLSTEPAFSEMSPYN